VSPGGTHLGLDREASLRIRKIMFDFEVKIAQNEKEIQDCLKLRYEIFKIEMGSESQIKETERLETDPFDKFCDHLIVIDKTVDKVVGTYRLLLGSKVDKKLGFYSEEFFEINNIKKLAWDNEILELGRSCIHKDYRSRAVINLLWSGIAKYVKDNNVRYLFGPVRLLTHDTDQVSKTFRFIKENFYADNEFRVHPRAENEIKGLNENIEIENSAEIYRGLPPLIKGYLRVGVKVCGEPALNPALNSVVIFILLDTEKMSEIYRHHYT